MNRRRVTSGFATLLFSVTAVVSCRPAAGQEVSPSHRFTTIDVVVTEAMLREVYDHLTFDDTQRQIAATLWNDYWSDIVAHDKSMQARVDEIKASRSQRDSDKVRLVMLCQIEARLAADARLERLQRNLIALLRADQNVDTARVPIMVRRMYFDQRHDRVAQRDTDFLLTNAPLFLLVRDAMGPGGELAPLGMDGDAPRSIVDGRAQLMTILLQFEREQDEFYLNWLRYWRTPDDDRRAPLLESSPTGQRMIQSWSRRYDLLERTLSQIDEVCMLVGGVETRDAFRRRFNRAFCLTLYAEFLPDRVYQALLDRDDLREDQVAHLTALYAGYQEELEVLRQRAFQFGIIAMRHHFSPTGDEPRQLRFRDACMDIRTLVSSTVSRWQGGLTDQQRDMVRELIFDARAHDVRLLGPAVHVTVLR